MGGVTVNVQIPVVDDAYPAGEGAATGGCTSPAACST